MTEQGSCTPVLRHSRFLAFLCLLFIASLPSYALDRNGFTFTNYDLHVRVTPDTHGLTAEGKITLRNDSKAPQKSLALQISSTLEWQSVRFAGKPLTYVTQSYETDIDHTGAVSEATMTLPSEVAPGQTLDLQVSYTGTVPADSTRLTRIGSPEALALRSDWDRISPEFTAVRGFGHVCWYPVAMDSVSLSEGNSYFDAVGDWKQRHAASAMKLTIDATGETTIAANGRLTGAGAHASVSPEQRGSRQAEFSFAPVGLYPPSFAIANYAVLDRPAITISHLPDHSAGAQEFALAAEKLLPFITGWFGPEHQKVQVIELADPNAVPFDSGTVVFMPLRAADRGQLEVEIAHQLAHACERAVASRPWIAEGLAQFAQALVREQQGGRKAALDWMNTYLPALQAAEKQALSPEQPPPKGEGQTPAPPPVSQAAAGQPLSRATDPTYYSIKAMFVWWMLRDMVGDDAIQHAIRLYDPAQDKQPAHMQRLIEAQAKRDLEWFFDDWVYRDRGLPDFRVSTAFARSMLPSNISVTVTIENIGAAGAEVPFTVQAQQGEASARVLVKGKSNGVQRVQLAAQPVAIVVNDGSVPESDMMTNNSYQFPAAPAQ